MARWKGLTLPVIFNRRLRNCSARLPELLKERLQFLQIFRMNLSQLLTS